MNKLTVFEESVKNNIYTIRNVQIMLDKDLAALYGVLTRDLNKAVKRNIKRFPQDFMFQLSKEEFESLMFHFGTSKRGGTRKLPYAFTEHGIATLSGILNSPKAIEINIQIVRAFVSMRKFLASNAQLFQRLNIIEKKQIEYDLKIEEIFTAIQDKDIRPEKGIFFNGQIFDSYRFVSDVIRTANNSIILIDNYVDDSVLTVLNKRNKNVQVIIFTKEISKELLLDLTKHNLQYPKIEIQEFKDSHDRFLIIDNKIVYHLGASLKDLGKKWFAFSKFDKEAFKVMERLNIK